MILEIIAWTFAAIVVLTLLFQLGKGIKGFFTLWYYEGFKLAIFFALFLILLCAPSVVKAYAPSYYSYAVWALILYCIGFIVYRLIFRRENLTK